MKNFKAKVLLAEDDENLGTLLKEYLTAKGFETDHATDGEAAYKLFKKNKYDICILDVIMPVKDGFTLARDIRVMDAEMPIVFLTAKSLKDDVIEGFKLGADDYITKPFSMEELLFRIEAVLRRLKSATMQGQTEFKIGLYTFDSNKQILAAGNKSIKLTTKENELLQLLCEHKNNVLDRNYALKKIWIDDNYFNARSMDVYITKLRGFLKPDPSLEIITIKGVGYRFVVS